MKKKILQILLVLTLFVNQASSQICITGGDQNGGLGSGGRYLDSIAKVFLEWVVEGVLPRDPNEIKGPKGYAQQQWVSIKDNMGFRIDFENDGEEATAPAQNVFIHLPITNKININSFRLGSFGFGQYTFQIPDNLTYYTKRLNVRDSLGLFVDFSAGIDIVKNEVFWSFRSIDPNTGLTPTNALHGFLPVSDTGIIKQTDTTAKGQGYVTFLLTPESSNVTGDTTTAIATIVFDVNEEIATNTWTNTIDAIAPVSKIDTGIVVKDTVKLQWSGQDDVGGSGVRDYALYYSENSGTFKLYRDKITDPFTTFIGSPGVVYCFYIVATDNTGNKENANKSCEFSTGSALPITWLYFKGQPAGKDALLSWGTTYEINTKEFIVERSLDGRSFSTIGSVSASGNSTQTNNYTYTDINVLLLQTTVLYYRLKQVDMDGKFVYSIVVSIPVPQTGNEPMVKAFPNPFTQTITLQILHVTLSDKKDNVELYSLDGKRLYQKRITNINNSTVLLNDLPPLKPGAYVLKTVINNKLFTIKMIKQ